MVLGGRNGEQSRSVRGGTGFGDRIETARAERPAAEQPPQGEPQPSSGTVDLERFDRIAGAARCEPTRRWSTREGTLVPTHRGDQPAGTPCIAHRIVHVVVMMREIKRSRSAASSLNDRSAAAGVAPMRYKPAGRLGCSCRSRERSRRRRRLRDTAGPTARPIAYATCGGETRGSGTNVHHRTPVRTREPLRARRSKEDRPRTRPIKPTDGDGPWPDEPSARRAHRECSSGRGSHASWRAANCSVERCASTPSSSAGSTTAAVQHEPHGAPTDDLAITTQGYGVAWRFTNRWTQRRVRGSSHSSPRRDSKGGQHRRRDTRRREHERAAAGGSGQSRTAERALTEASPDETRPVPNQYCVC